jgi:alpha-L-fucosidase
MTKNILFLVVAWLVATPLLADEAQDKKPELAKPTQEQLAFMDFEIGVFFHYGLNTYTGQHHGDGLEPASKFNPTALDPEQWVIAAKSLGAKYAVFTSRHEEGFCMWPTKTTDYGIAGSPYKNGKGDVVRDFVNACRKHGLKPCLYHTAGFDGHHTFKPEDKEHIEWGDERGRMMCKRFQEMGEEGRKKFIAIQVAQMTELLTNYGDITYIWCDHWNPEEPVWREVTETMRKLQPHCIMIGPDISFAGNEQGRVVYPAWYAINTVNGDPTGLPDADSIVPGMGDTIIPIGKPFGKVWRGRECDITGEFESGDWFWHPPKREIQPLKEHIDLYYRTVGMGTNLIINLAPDDRGLLSDQLVTACKTLGDELRRRFAKPIAEKTTCEPGDTVELAWSQPCKIDTVVSMENIANGQKIAGYNLEAWVNGQWTALQPANDFHDAHAPYPQHPGFETIGHKKIDRVEPVVTNRIRFHCVKSEAQPVELRRLAVFCCGPY